MNKKNKIIVTLISVAVVLFVVIQFVIVPANEKRQNEYAVNQTDSLTHDYTVIENYKNPYIGDSTNVSQLFYALPLNDVPMKFEIDSEDCTLTVYYLETVWNIGEDKVHRDLIYNTVAAMAAIDNLKAITYEFSGTQYSYTREQIEKIFKTPLSSLLSEDIWEESLQNNLNSDDFVAQFYQQ